MHAIHSGWVGQTFALATSNDAGGKKSRIRRSKEERKTMVESFIKKYQKSNNGTFPSLNLTHKEVGGSFYTVRELVREIIQENRVLAPPKKSLEEHDPSRYIEHHTLGSSPAEYQNDLSASDKFHMAIPILPDQSPATNGELASSSSLQFSDPELNNKQVLSGPYLVTKKDKACDETSISYSVPNHYLDSRIEEFSNSGKEMPSPWRGEFENEKIVNGSEGLEEDSDSDKPLMTSAVPIYQDNSKSTLQSSQKITVSLDTQEHGDDRYLNSNEQMVDKLDEAERQACMESVDMEILSKDNVGFQDKEVSHVATSNTSSAVEIFPASPVSRAVLDLDGASSELHGAAESSEDVANGGGKITFIESMSDAANANDEERLKEATPKLNYESKEETVEQNVDVPSSDDSKLSTTFSPSGLDNGKAHVPESKRSLLDETKVGSSTAQGGMESNSQNKNGLKKMDRINLETWKGKPKKSNRKESNPVLALVKAFFSAFVKLWTQ